MALVRPNHLFSTTLSNAADDSQTTLQVNAIPPVIPCILTLEPKTENEEKVKVTGSASGQITVVRGHGGTTPVAHNVGATIADYNAPEYIDELADAFEVEHNDDGTHDTAKVVTPTGTQTLINKTIDGDDNTFNDVPINKLKIDSQAQGDLLYYNGSAWARLGAGTDGQFLKTQGAGANPEWDDASGASSQADQVTPGDQSIASSTFTDLTGGTVQLVLSQECTVWAFAHSNAHALSGSAFAYVRVTYDTGGGDTEIGTQGYTKATSDSESITAGGVVTLAAATYTFAVQGRGNTANGGRFHTTCLSVMAIPTGN